MNRVEIIGNVCHTPESKTIPSGQTVCTFDVAVNRRGGSEPITDYFRVSAWGKLGETCQQYLDKGRKVFVAGEVSARAYMGRDDQPRCSLEINAREVEFLTPRAQTAPAVAEEKKDPAAAGWREINDKDLPF